jgi:hypothetical protein
MAKKGTSTRVSAPKMSAEDKAWRARDDARTLADSRVILKDPARLKAAAKEADKMAKDSLDQAKAMKSVARKAK